jgi:hypothetical protein
MTSTSRASADLVDVYLAELAPIHLERARRKSERLQSKPARFQAADCHRKCGHLATRRKNGHGSACNRDAGEFASLPPVEFQLPVCHRPPAPPAAIQHIVAQV